jgi:predicted kinase
VIYVITGPPCVGKTTWVNDHAQAPDMVIDLDRLALAISVENATSHEYPHHIRATARAMRRIARTAAISYGRGVGDSYIIDSRPGKRDLIDYKRNRARFIDLDAPRLLLLERAKRNRPEWVQRAIMAWDAHNAHDTEYE